MTGEEVYEVGDILSRFIKKGPSDERTFWTKTRRRWEGVMHMTRDKNTPERGDMGQSLGEWMWLQYLRNSKGPVRVCVVSAGRLGGFEKRGNLTKSLKKDFGFYTGIQEVIGVPSRIRPHHISAWQHNITIGYYLMSCLLGLLPNTYFTFPQYLLFLNPELIMAFLWNISHYLRQNKINQNTWSNHCQGNQIYIIRIFEENRWYKQSG